MNVLTIGGAMVDTIVVIDSDKIEQMKMLNAESSFLLLEEGVKTEADQISSSIGGGAINAAVAAARLGHRTSTIVRVGRDPKAGTIIDRLVEEGVELNSIVTDEDEPTGASVIVSSHDRNAAVFTYRGANTRLQPGDIPASAFEGKNLVYVANLSNNSADCYPLIVERAKTAGAELAVNPGVRQLTARYDDFWSSLCKIDILSINRTEAQALMPRLLQSFSEGGAALAVKSGDPIPPLAKRGLRNGGYEMTLVKFMGALMELGVGTVVLTDGANGAFIAQNGQIHFREAQHVEAGATTGAGDAFSATFASYLSSTKDVFQSLGAAAINAASVVRFVDTQSGLLSKEALQHELERVTNPSIYSWQI
ncbi:carbohydrate kinase family protein [Hyphomicrobium methylovorum]|uniref:carbohydrate kinase family protein n=1 Tax=Hyphomicrobium methylovorum TaxID=84 RepID=UPI0015E6910C|nr:carbohydrate kinase family protein [Hyphomicrobium methylovorum]MBA2127614.1 carbohydrate kinase family protein [Hyphomicrobium methylovorum]